MAQCLDHLIATNATYFPPFDAVLAGRHRPTLWQRTPWVPGVFGRLVRQAVHPDSTKAYKASAVFRPAQSDVDATVVITRVAGLDLDRIVIASAVSPVVIYSLFDACRIIATHEERHVRQAIRVTETPGFPA